jgi:hypothetical protein|tara:strand:+ start:24989 stop:25834 length:846 start_codon:yes stop_codon:yes gene_type:complete
MSEYKTSPDHVALIIKKLLDWYTLVFQAYLAGDDSVKPPYILLDWLQNSSASSSDQQNYYDDLIVSVESVITHANEFIQAPKTDVAPVQEMLDRLNKSIERICDQLIQRHHGHDLDQESLIIRSGLNAHSQLVKDFDVELERRSRHGSSFVLGLVTLKSFDENVVQGRSTQDFFATSAAIKKCMRVFDEAYVLSDTEFAVMLKETDNDGGIRFYKRLEEILDMASSKALFCASEPVPGDEFEGLLKQMRHEVERLELDDPSSVIHQEVSPLEIFLQENKDA